MSRRIWIAASLLSADMARLKWSIERVAAAVDYVHCDVMDGHFVPNITFGAPVVRAVKRVCKLPLDVHLMIANPARWVSDYLEAGLGEGDFLTLHIEAEPDPRGALAMIHSAGVGAGISVQPRTPATAIEALVGLVDYVLVMTVEPGFGGQSFIAEMLPKIAEVRRMFPPEVLLAVDGGIDARTAPLVVEAGAELLVAGHAIYGKPRPRRAADEIRQAARQSEQVGKCESGQSNT